MVESARRGAWKERERSERETGGEVAALSPDRTPKKKKR
jgi:hypothetical protein